MVFVHLLTARDLALFRGERLLFRGISFQLAGGEALLLRGANGAGKTSLLRALAGLTPLAAGELSWNGAPALDDLPTHAARVAWLGHADAVKPALTVQENVPDPAALRAVGLQGFAALPARLLSAGQKRRLAIARVIATGAPLWLLDEPSTALDAAATERFAAICAAHRAAGGMLVASTHQAMDLPGGRTLTL